MKTKKILFFSFFTIFFSITQAQIISTIAGNATSGYSGDGGAATNAQLDNPVGIVVDNSGNIYLADYGNNVVRKVTSSSGIINTIAGNGYYARRGDGGYTGDGGQATDAELSLPTNVILDSIGNIYITDYFNNVIRKITESTGIITTIAGNGYGASSGIGGYSGDGGAATDAELDQPGGICMDHLGNLYLADAANCRIRKVTTTTGIISTVVGNGVGSYSGDGGQATDAELASPTAVVVDDTGNIYIADWRNSRIRKVSTSSGIISTVAGNGTAAYSGDGGVAMNAELNGPIDLNIDALENLYIADSKNNRIREVNLYSGIISTIAGIDSSGYSGDGGMATAAELDYPDGVVTDKFRNVYIGDAGYSIIRKITLPVGEGIEKLNNSVSMGIFPNPSRGVFTLYFHSYLSGLNGESLARIEIYNTFGEKVYTSTLPPPRGGDASFSYQMNISSQPNGVYFYRVISKNEELIGEGKIIIDK